MVLATQEGVQAGETPTYGEPGQQQYQPYPQQYAPPPVQPTNVGKFITKPLVAVGILIGIILVWLSLVILRFANGDESVVDFAYFLQFSGTLPGSPDRVHWRPHVDELRRLREGRTPRGCWHHVPGAVGLSSQPDEL